MKQACLIKLNGTVQGVGFRPFVYRLAHAHRLMGWVLNAGEGVEIWLEGEGDRLEAFRQALLDDLPAAAHIARLKVEEQNPEGYTGFRIIQSQTGGKLTAHISPDLALCPDCLAELRDPSNWRYQYPYINCTNCGPRYSIIEALPYDRPLTSMKGWQLCADCQQEYDNPLNRRFHAQPVACPMCGPSFKLLHKGQELSPALTETARLLREGAIVALKGIGGYHLACDARNPEVVQALRERKFRKEKAFALMVKDLDVADKLVYLTDDAKTLLRLVAAPIVLCPKKLELSGVAPENPGLGIMFPYTPLHYLLFDLGAPEALIMTSANHSSEPIAYKDEDALAQLKGIADAFLIGERPIVRRVDDSVLRLTRLGPIFLRRSRGFAPAALTTLPTRETLLAVGADLKNTLTLVIEGQAFVSQYLGDLEHYHSFEAFKEAIHDLCTMYDVDLADTVVLYDAHPDYYSSQYALELPAKMHLPVQHHQAHIAAVIAEKQAWKTKVLGIALDGTGYGEEGAIWGGEVFCGSLTEGFKRIAHLRYASLVGGDSAASYPVQAAAGFLAELELPDMTTEPFNFPERYLSAKDLLSKKLRVFPTTSAGRLFDTAAALLGFTRALSFEGQAAMWLEYLATGQAAEPYPFPFLDNTLDYRPLLAAIIKDRLAGRVAGQIAYAFHAGLAQGLAAMIETLAKDYSFEAIVLGGGVFQNGLLLELLSTALVKLDFPLWISQAVSANDESISLGQAAFGAFASASQQNA